MSQKSPYQGTSYEIELGYLDKDGNVSNSYELIKSSLLDKTGFKTTFYPEQVIIDNNSFSPSNTYKNHYYALRVENGII